ncbi:ABC transporter ATP-binding protein [Bdellovibrio bacteriovorus]|uniref:ABC-type phosphonate transport protein, ATP-binding n=1 Tax=Bdellovibrio bacteriovorus (strain ATCC 15356 / DSM 50701 / NCIMB 9529 / HD100) TaxID=264462 RepID=Q6MPJ3_BDEBA|nr:ABC transporter ATP-binding protein [Bdellovibrio bacteriovorus]AHZ86914.1 phosphonate ABC transporter ATP-binding protein [Bdellovibrio bacteriovorus]BEV67355.1 putative ABC transporter ATP-binding protein YxlF [Bdellovibrio bacteriovorus]CAE78805.1 ABC-type phosphonate transport protein, ATP-binding [Bdellovibrio bacteriovorus HD100]
MAVLSIEKLNKTFKGGLFEKDRHVLRDVTFSLPEGQTSGFVGSNGAGKTTTIKCLFDFIRPDSGQINFFGAPLTSESKTRIGYLPERPYLYEFLTGMEFLRLHWNLCYGSAMKDFHERAHEALKKVDLFEARDRRLRTYSKGMLQRIGIAQAILTRPDLLILDEPMSGLDPDGRAMVKDILREEQKRGVSLFFSSHLLQDMEELCTHLVVINRGQILYDGVLSSFMAEFQSLEKAFSVLKGKEEGRV